jgi:AcrR family transcriptional regulator
MARPRSEDKREAIMAAATRVFAAQGLGAPTALIAREAGVSNGSLFTYFKTKAELINQLYLELKMERAAGALEGLPADTDTRAQLRHFWNAQLRWAAEAPEKRAAFAHLSVSEDLTSESREAGHRVMADIAMLLERIRAGGPMKDAPLALVVALMNAVSDATIEFMARDPVRAHEHGQTGLDAVWRMIA